jgi:hypothetical protein
MQRKVSFVYTSPPTSERCPRRPFGQLKHYVAFGRNYEAPRTWASLTLRLGLSRSRLLSTPSPNSQLRRIHGMQSKAPSIIPIVYTFVHVWVHTLCCRRSSVCFRSWNGLSTEVTSSPTENGDGHGDEDRW